MIEVKDLIKYYGNRRVLHGLTFSIETGKICGFLGPNGSGKTTTMEILAGLLGPSSGRATVCGLDVVHKSQEIRSLIGYLPDNPPLHEDMLVYDFIEYIAHLHKIPSSKIKKQVHDIMEECDLLNVKNRIIGHLSKGYRQRVALCSALVHKPQVLILDEPTEGLDPNQILHIRNLIKTLAKDRTVILSSHILSEVQATCDDALIIRNGHIAGQVHLKSQNESQSKYIYSLAANETAFLNWITQQNFTDHAEIYPQGKNSVLVQFKPDFSSADQLSKVLSEAVNHAFPIVTVEQKKEGLEEIFFQIMKSQPNLI